MIKVLVAGGRAYADAVRVHEVLHLHVPSGALIIEGGCWPKVDPDTGRRPHISTDWLAHCWALTNEIDCVTEHAAWRKYGPAAGPLRNQRMIDKYAPDLGILFPGGDGTRDMKTRLLKAGIDIIEVA